MRPIRATALVTAGALAGFLGAAAVVKRMLPSRGDEESDALALVAIFDGIELENRAPSFRGGSVFTWFGGISLDLREATLGSNAHLSVNALFGGVAIRVPPSWRLESALESLAGGVDVRAGAASPDAPTLRLEGRALFGGIAVGARNPNDDEPEASDT